MRLMYSYSSLVCMTDTIWTDVTPTDGKLILQLMQHVDPLMLFVT